MCQDCAEYERAQFIRRITAYLDAGLREWWPPFPMPSQEIPPAFRSREVPTLAELLNGACS